MPAICPEAYIFVTNWAASSAHVRNLDCGADKNSDFSPCLRKIKARDEKVFYQKIEPSIKRELNMTTKDTFQAAMAGSLGNVVGSNIGNILLVL